MLRISILVITFLSILSCTSSEINYKELNRLIRNREFKSVIKRIERYRESTVNPGTLRKLNQLYIRADKGLLFNSLHKMISDADTVKTEDELAMVLKEIQLRDSLSQRWYYFDYYYSQGQYFALKADSAKQFSSFLKAIEYPATESQKKTDLYIDFAFHYAQLKHFEQARQWLDKGLRSFASDGNKGQLLDVYIAFMNGNYQKADSILGSLAQEKKNLNWQRVETFFNLYLDSLSLKNRFRLW